MRPIIIVFFSILSTVMFSQEVDNQVYDPGADALSDINLAVQKAKETGKHVFVSVGGNWCRWCLKFNMLMEEDEDLKTLLDTYYIHIKVNYDQDVKNTKAMEKMEYPQRFGFPVFVILDGDGKRIHTQDSGLLEEGLGYKKRKIIEFLRDWSNPAVDPSNYSWD